jgi:hypothetical protein
MLLNTKMLRAMATPLYTAATDRALPLAAAAHSNSAVQCAWTQLCMQLCIRFKAQTAGLRPAGPGVHASSYHGAVLWCASKQVQAAAAGHQ